MHRFLLGAFLGAALAAGEDCQGLGGLKLSATRITEALSIPAGDYKTFKRLPAFCRVAGVISPSSDSEIKFEVWMPSADWNGKFYGFGNGGYAGTLPLGGLANAIRSGYAAVSTDTGHSGTSRDARWAVGHPEKVIDFGYRAIHEVAQKGKAIVLAFYGSRPRRSYFSSCSNGGRQALMEAQRYPEDYDGIIAGAPANYWTVHQSNRARNSQAMMASPASYIPPSKLPAIDAAIKAACDLNDGVKDGVLENPDQCHPDLAVLQCKGEESDQCLTEPQVQALKQIYGGMRNSNGVLLYPGYSPGGEADGWKERITGDKPETGTNHENGISFFKYLVYNNPEWDYRSFDADRDVPAANEKLAPILNATDPDLRRFAARGGKLILYHGWSDPGIPPRNTINYYNQVKNTLGARQTDAFVRLYMVPGMGHCFDGSGPNEFGQFSLEKTDRNIGSALEEWVENGVVPREIIAAKYRKPGEAASGVVRTRPLCPYPQVAVYKGSGSTDDAANFYCGMPEPASRQAGK